MIALPFIQPSHRQSPLDRHQSLGERVVLKSVAQIPLTLSCSTCSLPAESTHTLESTHSCCTHRHLSLFAPTEGLLPATIQAHFWQESDDSDFEIEAALRPPTISANSDGTDDFYH
ncbi:hypothetical protein CCH79_00004644 [Gambusia affinis]|uniref:Uncharacterized protein n=1 Tax=Gambusia affinis TaxID=33528 RepID=A0A315V0F4_GAMAF|nr:hypothetical protein CCH79_00004644 [Gambusia affinis]